MKYPRFGLLAAVFCLMLAARGVRAGDAIKLGGRDVDYAVVLRSGSPIAGAAVDRLVDFINRLTGRAPVRASRIGQQFPAIVIGDAQVAREFGIALPDDSRDEAYSIGFPPRADQALIVIAGQSDKGIKQAVYRVMRNLSVEGDKLMLRDDALRSAPVLKLRVSHIGGAMGARHSPLALDWNMIARWDPARIGDYIDLLDFFGYNGIEEPPTFYVPKDRSETMLARRKTLREHLFRNGQIGVAKIDGTVLGAGTYTTNVPFTPATKARYEEYYREMAQTAAPFNDIVLTHWVDPGGWPSTPEHPCTIEMLQDLHMQLAGEFKRVNPGITSILSLWNMQNPGYDRWQGYQPKGVAAILGSGKAPKDIGFTQSRIYRAEEAKQILAAGHPLGIWGWYTADNELTYTMHVHTHLLKAAMDALPPDAGETISFYSMDNCQREFNIYSTFVAGQLLWDPKSDPEVHLREIARLIYGPKLEEPIFRALKAIADVRCGRQCRAYFNPKNGVSQEDALKQATEAWNGLKDVQIDSQYVPPIQFHRSTDILLNELKEQTRALAGYMQFLSDRKTEVAPVSGPFETYERMQYLKEHGGK